MRIHCPFCGERDHAEFSYEGDASVDWPDLESEDMDAWVGAVFQRSNPAGRHRELWQHIHGCRIWLEIDRDTVTHKIHGVRVAHAPTAEALEKEGGLGQTAAVGETAIPARLGEGEA